MRDAVDAALFICNRKAPVDNPADCAIAWSHDEIFDSGGFTHEQAGHSLQCPLSIFRVYQLHPVIQVPRNRIARFAPGALEGGA